jgi:hypothetical protein
MHPLSWASLPPPAGSRSKTHISLPRLATGRPFRSHCIQLGNTSVTSAGRAFRPQLTCPRPSLAAPYLPSPGPTFRPQLASYPAKSRLNWLRLPGPQPGVPSASNMAAIQSSYPLRVYSRSLDACMYIKFHWGYFAPPASSYQLGEPSAPRMLALRSLFVSFVPSAILPCSPKWYILI